MKSVPVFSFLLLCTVSCSKLELIDPAGFEVNIAADSILFAQIGDYGSAGDPEQQVSELVKSWNPDFIVSSGDNNYVEGKLNTLKENISRYYGDYIYNYDAPAEYRCNGKAFDDEINRFFPTPGNHDANNRDGLVPYYNFFSLPGIEAYYKFVWGPISFYSINSVEGDLNDQRAWLEHQLTLSITPFNIVFFHHPPYSSGGHGNHENMQWDFYSMGVDIIFTGHDHIYERTEKINEAGTCYIVNGIGGRAKEGCNSYPLNSDQFTSCCFDNNYGAIKVRANIERLILEFYSIDSSNQPIDRIVIVK